MKNYNKQDEVYCFILPIIQLVDEWRRLILAYSHWLILCNVQLTMQFKLFKATTMQNSTEKCKKNKINKIWFKSKKSDFSIFFKSWFFPTLTLLLGCKVIHDLLCWFVTLNAVCTQHSSFCHFSWHREPLAAIIRLLFWMVCVTFIVAAYFSD